MFSNQLVLFLENCYERYIENAERIKSIGLEIDVGDRS